MLILVFYYKNLLKNNKEAFTLIELIAGLAIGSIVISSFVSMFLFCTKVSEVCEEKEDLVLNGRFAIEYIKKEIKGSDEIISIEKIENYNEKYSKNFGFVIKEKIEIKSSKSGSIEKEYKNKYIIYYIDGNYLRRDVATNKTDHLPKLSEFEGNNTIVGNIKSIENSYTDFDRKIIVISLLFEGKMNKEMEFNSEIAIRAPINY